MLPDSPEGQHPAAPGNPPGPHSESCSSVISFLCIFFFPQELTWSHTHISNHVSGSCSSAESVWPELLLQANIEQVSGRSNAPVNEGGENSKRLLSWQFDKVQESFLSLEQQITAFQAHLEGLGKASRDGSAGKVAHAKASWSVNSTTSDGPLERQSSTSSSSASASSSEADAAPRSPLHLSSTIGQLHKFGRKK